MFVLMLLKDIFCKRSNRACDQDPWHSVKFYLRLGEKSGSGNMLTSLLDLLTIYLLTLSWCIVAKKQILIFMEWMHQSRTI